MLKYFLVTFALSLLIVSHKVDAEERIETITFLTSYCDDCGMDFTGSVAVKVQFATYFHYDILYFYSGQI